MINTNNQQKSKKIFKSIAANKKLWLLYFLMLSNVLFASNSYSQYVYLENEKFKLNGVDYYPMTLNYGVMGLKIGSNYAISPDFSYGDTPLFECNSLTSCADQIQTDFNYIAGMGFNSIRLVGFNVKFIPNIATKPLGNGQLTIRFFNYNDNSGSDYLPFNPANSSDPLMLQIFSLYDKVLEKASLTTPHPLKVILLTDGSYSGFGATEVTLLNQYYDALTTHFKNSSYNDALMAYDLINEPCSTAVKHPYTDETLVPVKSKMDACEMVGTWYDIMKGNDPNHLITIGSCTWEDVFNYDPAIMKLDFLSPHYYPHFTPNEDRSLSSSQIAARNRGATELFWFNQISPLPWMTGENGFSSHPTLSGPDLDGSLSQLGEYVDFSLNAVFNCGGVGFSWWNYQDNQYNLHSDGPTNAQDNFGLLSKNVSPSTSPSPILEKQPAINHFRNYIPAITASCPVDYTPNYNAYSRYYNLHLYLTQPIDLTGIVTDQFGTLIQNAVIFVRDNNWNYYSTYTDANGFFRATSPLGVGIKYIKVSATGAEIKQYENTLSSPPPSIIYLERANYYPIIDDGLVILNGQSESYYGSYSLIVKDLTINSGAICDLSSSKKVLLSPGFHAKGGSSTHAYIDIMSDACVYLGYTENINLPDQPAFDETVESITHVSKERNNSVGVNHEINSAQNEISFKSISVYPNPNDGLMTIQLLNSEDRNESISTITVFNVLGNNIFSVQVNNKSYSLDLSSYPKGTYFLLVKASSRSYYEKVTVI